MFSFFKKYKSFKINQEVFSKLPSSQKRDPITTDSFKIGDKIVVCDNCGTIHHESTWDALGSCANCNYAKSAYELNFNKINPPFKNIVKKRSKEKAPTFKSDVISLFVRILPSGDELEVELPIYTTGKEIKKELLNSGIVSTLDTYQNSVDYQLIFKRKNIVILDNKTIYDLGIENGDTIYLAPKLPQLISPIQGTSKITFNRRSDNSNEHIEVI